MTVWQSSKRKKYTHYCILMFMGHQVKSPLLFAFKSQVESSLTEDESESNCRMWAMTVISVYLFDVCLHIWIGGLCSGGGAVVVVSQVIFKLVSLSLYRWFFLFLFLLPLGFCFAPQLPFGFQHCKQYQHIRQRPVNDYRGLLPFYSLLLKTNVGTFVLYGLGALFL